MEINLAWKKFIEDKIKDNNNILITHLEFQRIVKNIVSHPQSMLQDMKYLIKCSRKDCHFHNNYEFGSKYVGKIDYEKNFRLKDNRDSLCTLICQYRDTNYNTIHNLDKLLKKLFESFWKPPLRTLSTGLLDIRRDKRVGILAQKTVKAYAESC